MINPKNRLQNHQDFILDKNLPKHIKVYYTEAEINDAFIIIDDKKVIHSATNFNFKNIYSNKKLTISDKVDKSLEIFNKTLLRSSLRSDAHIKINIFKKFAYTCKNIFYSFL